MFKSKAKTDSRLLQNPEALVPIMNKLSLRNLLSLESALKKTKAQRLVSEKVANTKRFEIPNRPISTSNIFGAIFKDPTSTLTTSNIYNAQRYKKRVEKRNNQPNSTRAKNLVNTLNSSGLERHFLNNNVNRGNLSRELLPYVNVIISEINKNVTERKAAIKRIESKRNSLPSTKVMAKKLLERTRKMEALKLRTLMSNKESALSVKSVLSAYS